MFRNVIYTRKDAVESNSSYTLSDVKLNGTLIMSLQILLVRQVNGVKRLWMIGVDQNGYSACIGINDFCPTFFINYPEHWDQDEDEDELLEELKNDLNGNLRRVSGLYVRNDEKNDENIFINEITRETRTPFIGFSNRRRDKILKVSVANIYVYHKVLDFMKKYYTLYHADFELPNQFLQQTSFSYQSWLELKNISYRNGDTYCNIEGRVDMKYIKEYTGEVLVKIPPTLKCFLRLKTVSRDGVVEKKSQYHPNPQYAADRILCLAMSYIWSYQEDATPIKQVLLTVFPYADLTNDRNVEVVRCGSEQELLERFRLSINTMDPDDIFYFPDFVNTFTYIAERAITVHKTSSVMFFERFKKSKCRTFSQTTGKISGIRCESRSLFNMQAALKKKVFISVESYDLKTISCHPVLRKTPEDPGSFKYNDYDTNILVCTGVPGRATILNILNRQNRLLTLIERDCGMRIEYANISRVSDTNLTATVSRGEQIRVYNKLIHFCMDENFYLNREKVAQRPLRFSIRDRPPTYTEPVEHPSTTKLRDECYEYLKSKQEYYPNAKSIKRKNDLYKDVNNFFGDGWGESEQKEESKSEGGNVMKPCPKFWGKKRIAVFDFASLYPSIMRAFNISYENLVYDKKYLDLPGVDYLFIPINSFETVAIADVPGLIPKLLKLLVDSRSAIKKKMKAEQDEFRKSVYDKEQNSMKVLCNATYGFCGAETKGAILAVKPIMYIVTSIGRYLQKKTSEYLSINYNIPSIYGDSVTGDTTLIIRLKNVVQTIRIDELHGDWKRYGTGKEAFFMDNLEVWQDGGFTKVNKIIRHKCNKPIVRIMTNTGIVDCTTDHSLLKPNGVSISPNNVQLGEDLLHYDYVHEHTNHMFKYNNSEAYAMGFFVASGFCNIYNTHTGTQYTWSIHNADYSLLDKVVQCLSFECEILHTSESPKMYRLVPKGDIRTPTILYTQLFYNQHFEKHVPKEILNADITIVQSFWDGFSNGYGSNTCPKMHNFTQTGKELCTGLSMLANRLGWKVRINDCSRNNAIFHLSFIQKSESKALTRITTIRQLSKSYQKYVYDLETSSHHFGVGPGHLIVHNTDSVFVIVDHDDDMKIRDIAIDVGKRYKMEGYNNIDIFNWENILKYYQDRKCPLDLTNVPRDHKVNAILYLVYGKLCEEVTSIFRKEIVLEFENMSDNVWMGWVKKHYCYRFWDPNDPTMIKNIKITGMPVKKREYTPWTREVLMRVTKMLLYEHFNEVKPYVESELKKITSGQVPVNKLKISRSYKGVTKYRHFRQPHLQVVLKLEERHRWPVNENSRVYFVVVTGKDKLYLRSETPDYVESNDHIKIDLEYYLKQQFYKPMKKLLTYHPEFLDFETLFQKYLKKLIIQSRDVMDISNAKTKNMKKMTLQEAIIKRKLSSNPERLRKRIKVQPSLNMSFQDPFAKFGKK